MADDKTNSPDYQVDAYKAMSPAWKIVGDVSGGTQTIRAAGVTYLPREMGERPDDYNRRLVSSVFFNAYAKTRDALVGLVFKSDPTFDVPPEIEKDLENINLAGDHVDVFAKELFSDAFEGHSFILVDMQPALNPGATLADERAAGRRPFWVRYKACQAVNWRTTIVNGETVLQQITFEEESNEPDGAYGEKEVCRYRVFKLGDAGVQWELWEVGRDDQGGRKVTPASVTPNSGTLSVERIPVAVVYGNRTAFLESTPPLLDLAYLNIDHYQQVSDYRTQLHFLLPMLVRVGVPEAEREKFQIGPLSIADIPNKDSCDIKYVSHDGRAIEATRQAIKDAEDRMASMGLSMLTQKGPSNKTATEVKSANLQQSSDLATMARSIQDALELALEFHAEYLGIQDSGTVKMGTAEADIVLDGVTITALSNCVSKGQISLDSFLNILESGLGGFDAEEESQKLKSTNAFPGGQPPNNTLQTMLAAAGSILQPPAQPPSNNGVQ